MQVLALAALYCPVAHPAHDDDSSTPWYLPSGQVMQNGAAPSANLPCRQLAQPNAAATLFVEKPLAHAMQLVSPPMLWNFPTGQGAQCTLLCCGISG